MAQGFIVFKDRSCFAVRWTGYDEIIRIIARELYNIDKGEDLANWLLTIVPRVHHSLDKENNQWGTGFINPETNEMFIGKELDLRSLTPANQTLFWDALQLGYDKLSRFKEDYSSLNPSLILELLKRKEIVEKGGDPLNHSDLSSLVDEEFEEQGPGWK